MAKDDRVDCAAARAFLDTLPQFWTLKPEDMAVHRLGGLTNKVFFVELAGEQYALRLPGSGTDDYINRKAEIQATQEAARVGVSPSVFYADPEKGVLITHFIDHGLMLSPDRLRDRTGAINRTAAALKLLHHSDAKFHAADDPATRIQNHLNLLAKKGLTLSSEMEAVLKMVEKVKAALTSNEKPATVPCHGNPLCEDLLDTAQHVRIVDWEYAGMGDGLWDLGSLASEALFTPAQDSEFLTAYFGTEPEARVKARYSLYKFLADVLSYLWSQVQLAYGNTSADFSAHAQKRLARAQARMVDADFTAALQNLSSHA